MGSFEIIANGVLLFSKLSLGYFPHVAGVTARVMQFVEDYRNGRDLTPYTDSKGSPVRGNSASFNKSGSPKKKLKYVPDYKDQSEHDQSSSFVISGAQEAEKK